MPFSRPHLLKRLISKLFATTKSSSRGSYLLEFSLVAIGTVTAAVALIDVASIFHAKHALSASLEAGLRCIYPNDPSCDGSAEGSINKKDQTTYDVWVQLKSGDRFFEIPQILGSAWAEWIALPRLEYQKENVELKTVEFPAQTKRFALQKKTFPQIAQTSYLLKVAGIPSVEGLEVISPRYNLSGSNPSTFDFDISKKTVSVAKKGDVATVNIDTTKPIYPMIEGVEQANVATAEYNAKVNDKLSNGACFEDGNRSGNRLSARKSDPGIVGCKLIDSTSSLSPGVAAANAFVNSAPAGAQTQILLALKGQVFGADPDAQGSVEMMLYYLEPDSSNPTKMIERPLRSDLNGRLISYGSSGDFVVRGLGLEHAPAFARAIAHGDPEPQYLAEVRDHAKIIVPVGKILRLKLIIKSTQGAISWRGTSLQIVTPRYKLIHDEFRCELGETEASKCFGRFKGLPDEGMKPDLAHPEFVTQKNLGCAFDEPALPNDPEIAADPTMFKVEEDPSLGACGIQKVIHDCPLSAIATRFTGCTSPTSIDDQMSACPPPPDANVKDLKQIKWTVGNRVDNAGTAEFSCSAVREGLVPQCAAGQLKGTDVADISKRNTCAQESYFAPRIDLPDHDMNRCVDIKDVAKRELLARSSVPETIQLMYSVKEHGSRASKECPSDSCVVCKEKRSDGSQELLCGRGLSRAAAENCCKDFEGRCRMNYSGSGSKNGSYFDAPLDLAAAEKISREAIEAISPAISSQCVEGSHGSCSRVHFDVSDDGIATGSATAQVPLYILAALSEGSVTTVSAQSSRKLEKHIVAEK